VTGGALTLALWVAALVPGLLALNLAPSPTILNQIAAWAGWGLVAVYASRESMVASRLAVERSRSLWLALALVGVAAAASGLIGGLPAGLAAAGAGTAFAAAGVAWLGAVLPPTRHVRLAWFGGCAAAAAVSALIACVQVFVPSWADGNWIAHSGVPGRAVGNVRQPNHLASLLLWGAVALVPLHEMGVLSRSRWRRSATVALFALLVLGVMLSGSRTGLLGLLGLCLWGLLDARLSRFARGLLASAPLWLALAWGLVDLWSSSQSGIVIGTAQRVGDGDLSTGRFAIWREALLLLAEHPLLGVGYGEFNRAWTLTPFPSRSPQFFDHTHDLPLQLLVELGLPLGLLVLGLLSWALWQAGRRAVAVDGDTGVALRATFVMVLLMGLHSLLEYPLWYAHFLLPTAFAWGLCLGAGASSDAAPRSPAWPMAVGTFLVAGAALMLWDYQKVTAIFAPPDDGTSLEQRIAVWQRSWLFAHHADYARLTALEDTMPPSTAEFGRATHFLLDTRLLTAWARAYAREGDIERARWIADRLRELRQPSAEAFFAPCSDTAVVERPFQCTPTTKTFSWRDFR
jgi:O-antigen ligase